MVYLYYVITTAVDNDLANVLSSPYHDRRKRPNLGCRDCKGSCATRVPDPKRL